jgi:hypothetical protein
MVVSMFVHTKMILATATATGLSAATDILADPTILAYKDLGVVGLLILALVTIYRDSKKAAAENQAKWEAMVKQVSDDRGELVEKVTSAISQCHRNQRI